jgi:glycosyltransferase involved in cell wall biosynthesis
MDKGISIIVCCYNSALRLPETLRYLAAQEVLSMIPWEVIIVNNASKDNTSDIAKLEWGKYHCKAAFKVIDQPIPGLSAAREKGIETSKFEYVLFCDDDNWLDKNYVNIAFETMESHPDTGIIGGQSSGFFEIQQPFWFQSFSQSYVVEKPMLSSGYLPEDREYLAGAGMLIRKGLYRNLKILGFNPILTGRNGKSLMSGEDYELCLLANYLGYRIYYEERLSLVHFMTKERLSWDYCIKMTTEGHAIPEIVFDLYRIIHYFSLLDRQRSFTRIYLRLLKNYFNDMVFAERKDIKGIFYFFINIHLFFRLKAGSLLQRKMLSSKNKLLFLLYNIKLLKRQYTDIQMLIERIKESHHKIKWNDDLS